MKARSRSKHCAGLMREITKFDAKQSLATCGFRVAHGQGAFSQKTPKVPNLEQNPVRQMASHICLQ